jgi:PST family polysaccharide transporter
LNLINKIKKSKNLQLIGSSLGFLMSEKVLRVGIGFFITAWISRHLGPESYGNFVYLTQYIMIFMPFVTFGMNELISRDIVNGEYPEQEILGTAFAIKIINAFIGIFFVIVSIYTTDTQPEDQKIILWLSILLIIHSFSVVDHWYEAHLKYKKLIISRNFGYLTGILFKVSFLLLELPFEYFVMVYGIEFILTRGCAFIIYFFTSKQTKWRFSSELFQKYIKESFPLFIVLGVTIFEQKVSLILLKKYDSKALLGQFSLAFVVFNTLNFLPNAIVTTLYPTIIKTKKLDSAKYKYRTQLLSASLVWMGILVFIGFNTIGGSLFLLIFGDKYFLAVEIMQWMSALSIFVFFEAGRKKLLILENAGKQFMAFIVSFAIISVSLQYFLVQTYSFKGIIAGTFLAYVFANIFSFFIGKNTRHTTLQLLKGIYIPFVEIRKRYFK